MLCGVFVADVDIIVILAMAEDDCGSTMLVVVLVAMMLLRVVVCIVVCVLVMVELPGGPWSYIWGVIAVVRCGCSMARLLLHSDLTRAGVGSVYGVPVTRAIQSPTIQSYIIKHW